MINTVLHGDCLELMKNIADKSIDMILCDLPYGTTACKWDVIIPFDKLWEQYHRIIKDNGAIVLTASQPFTSVLVMSNVKMFKEEIIWLKNKGSNGFSINQKHIKVHESILIFSQNSNYIFNPQKWLVQEKEFLTQRKTLKEFECGNNIYGKAKRIRKLDDGTRNPISIVTASVPITKAKNKKYNNKIDINMHPTQKPVALFEYLIKTYTNEGDIVLDNCAGSGTTAIAAINTNRNYILMEQEQKYIDIINNRIAEYTKQKTLF